jgi:pyruvate,water dikinase
MEPVLKEIAQRLNISLRQVRMMLPEEVAKGLLHQKVNLNLLNERLKLSIYGWNQRKCFCLSGNAVNNFFSKQVKKVVKPKLPRHITGSIAFSGIARGTVRIINMPTDMVKMKSGDILVSDATAPNLMPVIRLAAAIVTNEGGLTCHAAIVSRELKIPCVIGTKIATQVLKDGDRVEVDANKGLIRKV